MVNKSHTTNNADILITVCNHLQPILEQFVLVGGCATSLLITDQASPDVRPTVDVDLIVDILSLSAYYKLEKQLRALGFKQGEDDEGIICRWTKEGHIVDIMPTDEKIFGFSNPWYKDVVDHAVRTKLNNEIEVKHITAPYFLATKIVAFQTRGNGDYGVSHDIEDIVILIDGRSELIEEVEISDDKLKSFLKNEFIEMLKDNKFKETLSWHLPPDSASQAREPIILERIERLSTI